MKSRFCLSYFIVPTPDIILSISPNPVETGIMTNITCTVMLMNPLQYQSGEVLIQLLMGDTVIKSSTTSVNSNSVLTLSHVFSATNTNNGGIYNCTANVSHTNDYVLDSSTGENSNALTVQSEHKFIVNILLYSISQLQSHSLQLTLQRHHL